MIDKKVLTEIRRLLIVVLYEATHSKAAKQINAGKYNAFVPDALEWYIANPEAQTRVDVPMRVIGKLLSL